MFRICLKYKEPISKHHGISYFNEEKKIDNFITCHIIYSFESVTFCWIFISILKCVKIESSPDETYRASVVHSLPWCPVNTPDDKHTCNDSFFLF